MISLSKLGITPIETIKASEVSWFLLFSNWTIFLSSFIEEILAFNSNLIPFFSKIFLASIETSKSNWGKFYPVIHKQ